MAVITYIDGVVLYSDISYRASFQIQKDGKMDNCARNDNAYDTLTFQRGYGMDMIAGVGHTQTAKFSVYDFYIFYEKNTKSNTENN